MTCTRLTKKKQDWNHHHRRTGISKFHYTDLQVDTSQINMLCAHQKLDVSSVRLLDCVESCTYSVYKYCNCSSCSMYFFSSPCHSFRGVVLLQSGFTLYYDIKGFYCGSIFIDSAGTKINTGFYYISSQLLGSSCFSRSVSHTLSRSFVESSCKSIVSKCRAAEIYPWCKLFLLCLWVVPY